MHSSSGRSLTTGPRGNTGRAALQLHPEAKYTLYFIHTYIHTHITSLVMENAHTYTFTASHNQCDWSRHMLYHSLSCRCAQSINILYTPAWIRASPAGCDGHQTITHTQATRDAHTHSLSVKKKHTGPCKHCRLTNKNQRSSVKVNCGFHPR